MLLPLACAWAAEQERTVLQSGIGLTESQLADARQIGVVQPERVRLFVSPRFLPRQIRHWQQQPVRRILFLFLQEASRFVMAFLFESIVGASVLSLCINLFTPHSMNGSAGSRVFCALMCWNALLRRVIHMDPWSRKPLLRRRDFAPNTALALQRPLLIVQNGLRPRFA